MISENKEFLKDLDGVLKIKTVRGDCGEETKNAPLGKGVNDAIEYMLNLGNKFGFETKNLDGYCGYIHFGNQEDFIGILTHLDVVAADGEWDFEPFGLSVKDDKYYSRGIIDDKGPAMMSLYAMKEIKDSGIPLNKGIRLIMGGDEETGKWECIERYKKTEKEPTLGFTPDGEFPVVFAEKGMLKIKINCNYNIDDKSFSFSGGHVINIVPDHAKCVVNNEEHEAFGIASHASEPQNGENALLKLAKQISSKAKNPFVDFLADLTKENLGIDISDEPSGELTFNPAIVNADCSHCEILCDIRYPVTKKLEDFYPSLEKSVKAYGFDVEVLSCENPLYEKKDGFLVTTLKNVYEKAMGEKVEPVSMGGGTYAKAFKNTVAFGIMFPDCESGCHVANEHLTKNELNKSYDIVKDAIVELSK